MLEQAGMFTPGMTSKRFSVQATAESRRSGTRIYKEYFGDATNKECKSDRNAKKKERCKNI